MAEEEKKGGEEKGDHINLKVKDQVSSPSVVSRKFLGPSLAQQTFPVVSSFPWREARRFRS